MFIDSVCCAKDSFVMSYNRKYPKKEYLATNFPNPRNHIIFVEVEQAQQQPDVAETFAPTSVTNFGNHVLSNDLENNQAIFNKYEVDLCVRGDIF